MKKIIALASIMLFVTAGPALAVQKSYSSGALIQPSLPVTVTGGLSKLSNGVSCTIASNASQFAMNTIHKNGNKEYATSSVDGKIYWKDVTTTSNTAPTVTLSNSDTTDFSSWSSL